VRNRWKGVSKNLSFENVGPKQKIEANKIVKVAIVGNILSLGFKRTKSFGEEKSGTWKREIESPSNMENPSQKTKEVENLSNSNDDLNKSLNRPS
jgi:hypothetical protein